MLRSRSRAITAAILFACALHSSDGFQPQLIASSWRSSSLEATLRDPNVSKNTNCSTDDENGYTVQVSYEGLDAFVQVRPNESILAALERTSAHSKLLLSSLPHECRRGNCLTCAGRHLPNSTRTNLEKGDDGLNPQLSKEIWDGNKGFVLTCSSFVTGDGVKLELGVNFDAWDEVYAQRFRSADGERVRREAVAKTMRLADERNIEKWAMKTKKMMIQNVDE